MTPIDSTLEPVTEAMPWLVMYSNSGDTDILDVLEEKKQNSRQTGVNDFFVPLEVMRLVIDGKVAERISLIAGSYIFIRATAEDILRLRQEPPFDQTLRFLHPASSPTGRIYIDDDEMQMFRQTVEKLEHPVEYFVPTSKELLVGDQVCILGDGPFAGIKGVLESVKGHEGGRVIVPLGDVLAVRTPRIPVDDIQLLSLAKTTDNLSGSYTSRAYKKVRVLMADSERLLAEKEKEGKLSETSHAEAVRLLTRFFRLRLGGKIRLMHAQAIYNLLLATDETDTDRFRRFSGMLP